MKNIMKVITLSNIALAASLWLSATTLHAQNGPPSGGFDPQQMRQRVLQNLRERLEVTDDSEWKLISERITKVMDARRAANPGPGGFGMFGGFGGPPPGGGGGFGGPGGPPPAGEDNQGTPGGAGPAGPPPGGFAGFNREPNPELEALQKAVESKASSAELKARMAELKASRARKQAELETARESLRQLLSARQEAIAMAMGLL
jgi:hypothetical protein